MVETIAGHTWNTLESGSAEPLPEDFEHLTPLKRLEILGFNKDTVDQMIEKEHDDWYRYYIDGNWKYSEVRNDDENRHNGLKPWKDIKDDPKSVDRARTSLVSTLISLRTLGYRSVPKASQPKAEGILQDVI